MPLGAQRQAVSIVALALSVIATSALTLLAMSGQTLDRVLFETISAFGTVGLSTGITADLPAQGQVLLIVLMFLGRVGTITLASALALRARPLLYRHPEERPILG
jgi:trk system potassium uptake protein TrkH